MKIIKIFLTVFLALFLTGAVMAQSEFTTNAEKVQLGESGLQLLFEGVVDTTTDSLISSEFTLADYDNDANPTLVFDALLSGGTASTQKVTCQLLGVPWYGATPANLDTILLADSAITYLHKTFNTNSNKYAKYKLRIFGAAGNVETDFKFSIYCYKRDY